MCGPGGPDIFPVSYVVDHGSIVFRTAAGSKLAASAGRQVAFEGDGRVGEEDSAWSVVVRGRAAPIVATTDVISALGLPLTPLEPGCKPWLVRIVPVSVTGRRIRIDDAATGEARSDGHAVGD